VKRRTCAAALAAIGLLLGSGTTLAATYEERFEAGVAARREGRLAEAVTVFSKLEAEDPRNTDVLVQLGFSHLAANDLDSAQASFERALAIAPEYRDANLGLAQIAVRRGKLDLAEQQANIVLASRTDAEAQAVPQSSSRGACWRLSRC
jgi:tetratricopeptide (TPR) repeat protein